MADEPMLFVGNLPQCNADDVRRWLEDSDVRVVHVEMKTGFAFVRVADNGSKDRALDVLDKSQFNGRQVSVQIARGDGHIKSREAERKKNAVQTETVFIVNYEPTQTNETDIRAWCSPFGEIKNFLMTGKYCFVQFSSIQEAVDCQQALNDTTPGGVGKQITVEFSSKDWSRPPRREGGGGGGRGGRGRRDDRDDRRGGGYGGRRDDRRGGDRRDRRSPSPHYRRGRSPSPRRGGDDYDRRGRSPSPRRGDYDRRGRSPSPPSYRSGRDRSDPYGGGRGGGGGGDRRDSFNGGRDYGRYDDRRDDHRGGGGAPRDDRVMDRRDDDRDFR